MKRICIWILILALLGGNALAALEYNSFMDDTANAGQLNSWHFVKAGEYIYWLYAPEDPLTWVVQPPNLYRMQPGKGEAELVLQGREDFWMYDLYSVGERLLLGAAETEYGQSHPAVVNPDGNSVKMLNGNIGSVVVCGERIYNSVDGAIYEIDADELKPKKIYTYPREIAEDNPVLFQCEGLNLYFGTDSFDQYRLDLQFDELTKIDTVRGDGFVKDYKFYVSDYDNGGTYRYDLATGQRTKVSGETYQFMKGDANGYVRANLADAENFARPDSGRIFDITWICDALEETVTGKCCPSRDFLLDGTLYHYDVDNNRVDFSKEPVAKSIKK